MLALAMILLLVAAPLVAAQETKLSEVELGPTDELIATIEVTKGKEKLGDIVVRLHHKYAPKHVKNFVKLAEEGFYDGTLFHRSLPELMIQGGDPLSRDGDPSNDGTGGPGYELPLELNEKPHVRGTVSAAKMQKNDNGSQFFICLKEYPAWDNQYTVFGNVMSGIEVADQIAAARRKGEHPVESFAMEVTVEKRTKKLKL